MARVGVEKRTWQTRLLGELCEVNIGRTPPRKRSEYWGPGSPWLSIADMNQGRDLWVTKESITRLAISECHCRLVAVGTVLLSFKLSIGKVGIARIPLYTNEAIAALPIRDSAQLLPKYLYWALRSMDLTIGRDRAAKGLTLNKEKLLAIAIPVPALNEQQQIAEILDKADDLRTKRRAVLAQLDTLKQAIFLDMFGDPVSNSKGWPTVRLEETCERVTVGIVVRPASYYMPTGVPALRSLNVRAGEIVLDDLVYFSQSDNDTKLAKTKLKMSDLVLVRSGQPGTAAVVPAELDGVNAIDLLIVSPLAQCVDVTFLCAFFNSLGGRDLVLSRQRGQVQKHLNVGSLSQAVIPLPPLQMQREFARRTVVVDRLKNTHRASLAELDAMFASLQHRAFRGEL